MAEVLVSSSAERDFTEALTWYVERSVTAAERFDAEFTRTLEAIAADPLRYPFCDDRNRRCLMQRFPFQVVFRQQGEQLVVVAVAHAKRQPNYWKT